MNICLIKLSAIGDVVHTLPSLSALKKLYPSSHLTWVIEEEASDLILDHPLIDRVLISRRKTWLKKPLNRQSIHEMKHFLSALRDRTYDITIDFHGLFKSAVICALSPSRRRIGYRSMQELSGLFYRERIPEDMEKHAVDRYLDFIRYLGEQHPRVEFSIPAPADVKKMAAHCLESEGLAIDETPFVAVNPVALWPTKLWGQEKFAYLSDMIIENLKLPVVFTGSKRDNAYILKIARHMKNTPHNLAGKTSLRTLAEIYRHALFVVTTDSGPMHIAAAVGTPVIALFGPTDPGRTGPYGPDHVVVRTGISCSPCFLKSCTHRICMEGIRVEDVFLEAKKMFERRR
ncbi:MAG: glycosyltransferase family 9 protein [Syntrophales bacterium]|nr:glycosyltransferase family 9 protein [Syntrophales bacterium]